MDVMPEQLDLYMCFQIWLNDISAFLVVGDFNWDKNYDVDALLLESFASYTNQGKNAIMHQMDPAES